MDPQWVTICNDKTRGEPIRALVDKVKTVQSSSDTEATGDELILRSTKSKTLLIATGKGRVRAGIFSRKHLLTTGLEPSTALPLIYQAKRRKMRIVILDPNARGDRVGMDTFETSMERIFVDGLSSLYCSISANDISDKDKNLSSFNSWDKMMDTTKGTHRFSSCDHGLYVLAHSQAGAQLVRYLHDKYVDGANISTTALSSKATITNKVTPIKKQNSPKPQSGEHAPAKPLEDSNDASPLFRIEAIAFTDSTHNIQWTKTNPGLRGLLTDSTSLYLRSAHHHHADHACASQCGTEFEADEHWKHRFGEIRTLWAGTTVHELVNWTGREWIWRHFDENRSIHSNID